MSYSIAQYTGNGSQTAFSVPFPFISRDHVSVSVAGSPATFTWVSDGLITVTPAPPVGLSVTISRDSNRTGPLVNFEDAQVLTADALDIANQQAIYISQEAFDNSAVAIVTGVMADAAAAAAASAVDADDSATAAAVSATAAATSAANAATYASNSASSATGADTSATDAAASAAAAAATLAGALLAANNLSDVASPATARTNLGLGSAAVLASTAVALVANNLSDLASAATARTNLGLGTAAVAASGAFATAAQGATADSAVQRAGDTMSGVLVIGRTASGDRNIEYRNSAANVDGGRWTWNHVKSTTFDQMNLSLVNDAGALTQDVIRFWRSAGVRDRVEIPAPLALESAAIDTAYSLTAKRLKLLSFAGQAVTIATGGEIGIGAATLLGDGYLVAQSINFVSQVDDGNSSTTKTINFSTANYHKVSMTGNCTFTFTAPTNPCVVQLMMTQSTGSHTMTLPSGKWPGNYVAADKLLSTAAGAIDILVAKWDGTTWFYTLTKAWA